MPSSPFPLQLRSGFKSAAKSAAFGGILLVSCGILTVLIVLYLDLEDEEYVVMLLIRPIICGRCA